MAQRVGHAAGEAVVGEVQRLQPRQRAQLRRQPPRDVVVLQQPGTSREMGSIVVNIGSSSSKWVMDGRRDKFEASSWIAYTCSRWVRLTILPDRVPERPWLGTPLKREINAPG